MSYSPTDSPAAIRLPAFLDGRKLGRFQFLTVVMCFFMMLLDGFDTQAINYMAPAIADDWGIDKGALGGIFSAALVGLMVGYLVLSPLSVKLGHRNVILIGVAVFAISTLLSVGVQNETQLLIMRFITGLGLGMETASAIAITAEYSPKRWRASFVLAIYCGFSLGFIVANYTASWLIPEFGWRSVFVAGGVAPLILLVILLRWLPESPFYLLQRGREDKMYAILRKIDSTLPASGGPKIEVERPESVKKVKLRALFTGGQLRGTVLLWLVFATNLAMFYGIQSWMPTILSEQGYEAGTLATAASMTTIGGIVIVAVMGPAMDRLGAFGSLCVLYLLGGVFLAVMSFAIGAPIGILLTVIFLIGCSVSGGQKSVIALASVFYREEVRAAGVSWALGIGRFGGILGPIIVGAMLAAGWGHSQVFIALAVPSILCGLIVLYLGARARVLARRDAHVETEERVNA
ncbi:MFS transporter, AAHS family, 4-hydroxybenzoate transporter [Prauserella aidingensis]|uniref:MFS transporter n=1 Tax=Prauserella aidingensis TaxID=387890 RepID=UPI0020A59B95|nr:MFS transporter [Prauserella aidingensis]MCP2254296.1 MFS transporter, AAHS family, 4-hydroxybenzoate transporter [Prauserella aidingensis]